MTKFTKISFILLGFSLALGGAVAFSKTSKKASIVNAGSPAIFKIGNHDLLTDPTWDENDGWSNGSATLNEFEGYYQLVLEDFSNEDSYSYDELGSYALNMQNLSKPVNICLSGDNYLANPDKSDAIALGIYISKVSTVMFSSLDDDYPGCLYVNSCDAPGMSGGLFAIDCDEIIINNCEVYLVTGKSKQTIGFATYGDLTIEENGFLNCFADDVTTGGSYSYGGMIAGSGDFHLDGGEAYFDAGNVPGTGTSVGFTCDEFHMQEGIFSSESGTANSGDSVGVRVYKDLVIHGGKFTAMSSESSTGKSYGIQGSSGKIVDMYSGMKYFYAHGKTEACHMEISPIYEGFGSYSDNIFTDSSREEIDDEGGTFTYKTIIFQEIIFNITYNPVVYDGAAHDCMTITVTSPSSGYTIKYQEEGSSEWVTTVPKYTNASSDPYVVDFLIEAPLYAQYCGGVEFYINKADSVVETAPTKVADFTTDGQPHALVNVGSVTGGTVMYSVNDGEYSSTVPTATDAGTYALSYKITGDSNYNDIAPVSLGSVVISKADPILGSTPTKVNDFEADGKDHALVEAGAASGGTIMYSVNGGEYSATIQTAKEAGSYEISYKVVGDANHNDIAPVSLGTVTVTSPVTPGPGTSEGNEPTKKGIGAGGVVGIVLGSLALCGIGGFSVFWFVVKKKTFKELVTVCKNFFNKIFKKKQ